MTTYHLGHVPGTVIVDKAELDALRAENERLKQEILNEWNGLKVENERLRAALADVLAIDHSERGCCEWHILNGKPWIAAPTDVLDAKAG